MPAYRSTDEAEIRDAAVARVRMLRPGHRIIHEINVAGTGSNRVDFIAVGQSEIIAVEVKSAKDKLDRLSAQIMAMKQVAHHVIAAVHEKFLIAATETWRSDQLMLPDMPSTGAAHPRHTHVWVYPEADRPLVYHSDLPREPSPMSALPHSAIKMLWANELRELCGELSLGVRGSATMTHCITKLRWMANGGDLTKGICRALRRRNCIEADAPQ